MEIEKLDTRTLNNGTSMPIGKNFFRAKLKDRKQWIEGFYCRINETTYCTTDDYQKEPVKVQHLIATERSTDWGMPNQIAFYEIDPATLCQYTGISKKNKKIWENDIICHHGIYAPIRYPTRRIAYPSICKRGDDDSMVMARFDPKANKQVLPINEKADRLTRDFQLFSDNCKILLRDGKVSAVLSKEYVILPADKMISILENQLKQDHPDFTFNRGQVSHEYLMVEYLMNDEEMEQSFRLKLNDAGADISELKAGIRFSTSDIGASKVYASVFYDADGVRTTCNSGIALEHKGEASPQLYTESCKQLGMVFKESEELIEKLGNMNISDVAGVVQEIRENYSIFPKGISEKVEAELRIQYPGGGTAIDVYLALNDIIQRYSEENKISPTRYLNLSEQVAKLMHLPFERIDQGEEWKKI